MVDLHDVQLRSNHHAFVNRFVEVCQEDDRVTAAFLGGSNVKGYADEYSDVDLCLITTDQSFVDFLKDRETFLRRLGDLVFLEDFNIPNIALYIFADDTEAVFPEREPASSEQMEKLSRNIYGFWHELSHFMTAMQRNQLWWAQGQLEALRSISVNLARLQHNFLDEEVGEEAYFKIEKLMPVEQLLPLKETFCPMEKAAMLKAGLVIVRFYRGMAPSLAELHRMNYPQGLERVMMDRLQKLKEES